MSKTNVKHKDKQNATIQSWQAALTDAEERLKKAQREIMGWKAVVTICRKRVADQALWPGSATHN